MRLLGGELSKKHRKWNYLDGVNSLNTEGTVPKFGNG